MNSLINDYNAIKSGCKNLLLIDNTVREAQLFASSTNASTFSLMYSSSSTKTELFALLKTTFTSIERIGLVFASNNRITQMFLENRPFFDMAEASASPYSENVEFIISLLKEFNVKNIDYLACNTLNFPDWVNYYAVLTKETGVIVGASNDKTGNIKYGGDWIMESTHEDIELIYFTKSIEYYSYLLDFTYDRTIIIKTDGTIYGTGYNSDGELGFTYTNNNYFESKLTPMPNTSGRTPQSVVCGAAHTIVLMTDGSIYGTGSNLNGELGFAYTNNNYFESELTPMPNTTEKTPQSVACGAYFTIVLMTDGSIYGTGDNNFGQLGLDRYSYTYNSELTPMPNTTGKTPQSVVCGAAHTIVLMTDGSIYGTGSNLNGELGFAYTNNNYFESELTPMPNTTEKTPQSVACGGSHTIVLMTDGSIYGTGYNSDGQLGVDDKIDRNNLESMLNETGKRPQSIACGIYHTIVLMTDGSIYGTGYNSDGELGLGYTTYSEIKLKLILNTTGKTPQSIACGSFHTIVLMSDRSIYGTGYNPVGQLGLGYTSDSETKLKPFLNGNNVKYVAGMTVLVHVPDAPIDTNAIKSPSGIAIYDSYLYVSNHGTRDSINYYGRISKVNFYLTVDNDNDDTWWLSVNYAPHGLAVDTSRGLLYFVNANDINATTTNKGTIRVVDIKTNVTINDNWVTGLSNPSYLAIDPTCSFLYVICESNGNNSITKIKINYKSNNRVATLGIRISNIFIQSVLKNISGICVDSDYLYIISNNSSMPIQLVNIKNINDVNDYEANIMKNLNAYINNYFTFLGNPFMFFSGIISKGNNIYIGCIYNNGENISKKIIKINISALLLNYSSYYNFYNDDPLNLNYYSNSISILSTSFDNVNVNFSRDNLYFNFAINDYDTLYMTDSSSFTISKIKIYS